MKSCIIVYVIKYAVGFVYEPIKKEFLSRLYQYSCNNSPTERGRAMSQDFL